MSQYRNFIIAGVVAGLAIGALVVAMGFRGTPAPDFTQYEAGPERKQAFFGYFLPIVQQRNQEILSMRESLMEIRDGSEMSSADERTVARIAESFGMETFTGSDGDWETLMRRVDVVPPSLALAQAANESAWGTSRFAVQGNNYFGQWCFEEGCGLVPRQRDAGKTHEVATFLSPAESVESYMQNLNRHNAYRELRDVREDLREDQAPITGVKLAAGLSKYSERGDEYISELRSMIRFNKLGAYDNAQFAAAEDVAPTGG